MNSVCPHCQKTLPDRSPAGLCPRCLLAAGLSQSARPGPETLSLDGFFNAPQVDELAPLFPQLTILDLLGHGGMGAVYRARQNNLDRPVALKILAPRLGRDPGFAERFAREARTMARLNHPNIVTVFDSGQAGPYYYLIMELVDGVNLREAILSGSVTPSEALAIVPKICDALQYAHDEGIIHRDIKPENILIGQRGQVTIADFGLAKLLGTTDHSFTLTGTHQVLGTRNYMAPEQIEKPQTVDHRADIYSLGVVFYELLTGELPLGRFSLPSEKASINRQLDEVVLRTLEKEPDRRFQQASAVKSAVESIDPAPATPPPNTNGTGTPDGEPAGDRSSRISLPWYNDEVHAGLSHLHGIAHLDDHVLELEFRVKRLGIASSTTRRVRIPLADILQARVHRGIFWNSLEIQSGALATFDEVPGCTQGRMVLYLDKKHLELSRRFCDRLNRLSEAHPPVNADQSATLDQIPVVLPMDISEARGLAKLTADSFQLEFQTLDWIGSVQSPVRHIRIPLSGIVSADFRPGLASDKITIQTDSLDLVSLIPNAASGQFAMKTGKSIRPDVEDFVRCLIRGAGLTLPESLAESKPDRKGERGRDQLRQALALPRWGLPLSAAINLAYLCLVAIFNLPGLRQPVDALMDRQPWMHSISSEWGRDWLHWVSLEYIDARVTVILSLVMIALAVLAWVELHRFRHYGRTLIALLVLALPFHPGAIASIPAGLWCVYALLRYNARLHFERVPRSH